MPVASTAEFESILMYLSVLRYIVKSKSKRKHYDLNKSAENFFREFLNLAFDYKLINLNDVTENHAAIDLGDIEQKICFQVTAENGSSKIKDTIRKFAAHGLNKKYSRLVMLLLTEKKNYSTKFATASVKFDTDSDIWDVDDLLGKIEKLPLEKKISLAELLKMEMRPIFSEIAESDSIFKVQSAANMPARTAKRLLDHLEYSLDGEDAKYIRKRINKLYSILSNLSRQARACLFVLINRGEYRSGFFQLASQEFDNLLSAIPSIERAGNFASLVNANLADYGDGMLIVRWRVSKLHDEFFLSAKEIFDGSELESAEKFKELIVDANFSLLD
ncbi:SMEK domain-containing protein [Janthinobacterium lividum]